MTVADRFAAHALGIRIEDVPPEVVARAKVFILDSLGVGIAGSSVPGGDGLAAIASGWGTGDVPVWGRAERATPEAAAFLNAWQMHNQEFDCLHEGAVVHAMATTLPVALAAAAQRGGVTGRELLAAVVAGTDIAAGLGLASRAGFRFFRPATAGGFGAVAAAGRILRLDAAVLSAAFAWQLAQVSGTMQAHTEGSAILPVQIAFNARAALASCGFATLGFPPTRQVFEGPYGYFALFEGAHDLAPVLDNLGRDWRIAAFSHKPYPAGRATHGGIEGAISLRAEHGFKAEDVAAVEIDAPPLIVRLVGRRPDAAAGAAHARLCMAHAVARVLLNGGLDLSDFRGEVLADPATLALAQRVVTRDDGNPDPNALAPQAVTIRLTDGRVLSWRCETMLAHPARPLTEAQHLAKFRRCLAFAHAPLPADRADRLIAAVDGLEALDDVGRLAALTQPAFTTG